MSPIRSSAIVLGEDYPELAVPPPPSWTAKPFGDATNLAHYWSLIENSESLLHEIFLLPQDPAPGFAGPVPVELEWRPMGSFPTCKQRASGEVGSTILC